MSKTITAVATDLSGFVCPQPARSTWDAWESEVRSGVGECYVFETKLQVFVYVGTREECEAFLHECRSIVL